MATLTLICGMAGAGKTTLAKRIEADSKALRLCPDEWLVELAGSRTDRVLLDRLRSPVQRLQWQMAREALRRGLDVVLEFGFWHREERRRYLLDARALGVRVEFHYLDVPKAVLLERLRWRNEHGGEADIVIDDERELDEWLSWIEPPDRAELDSYDHAEVHEVD